MPGPCSYNPPSAFARQQPSSQEKNVISPRFSIAHDRFKTPMNRRNEPGPGQYNPRTEMGRGVNSIFKKSAKAVIGKTTQSALDTYRNKKEMDMHPGPGSYDDFKSDFSKV